MQKHFKLLIYLIFLRKLSVDIIQWQWKQYVNCGILNASLCIGITEYLLSSTRTLIAPNLHFCEEACTHFIKACFHHHSKMFPKIKRIKCVIMLLNGSTLMALTRILERLAKQKRSNKVFLSILKFIFLFFSKQLNWKINARGKRLKIKTFKYLMQLQSLWYKWLRTLNIFLNSSFSFSLSRTSKRHQNRF